MDIFQKIYKYEIPIKEKFSLILPERSKILSVQLQNNIPMLWAAITRRYTISYDFAVYGTGHKMDEKLYHKYISTFQQDDFVWHIFQIATEDTVGENPEEHGYF